MYPEDIQEIIERATAETQGDVSNLLNKYISNMLPSNIGKWIDNYLMFYLKTRYILDNINLVLDAIDHMPVYLQACAYCTVLEHIKETESWNILSSVLHLYPTYPATSWNHMIENELLHDIRIRGLENAWCEDIQTSSLSVTQMTQSEFCYPSMRTLTRDTLLSMGWDESSLSPIQHCLTATLHDSYLRESTEKWTDGASADVDIDNILREDGFDTIKTYDTKETVKKMYLGWCIIHRKSPNDILCGYKKFNGSSLCMFAPRDCQYICRGYVRCHVVYDVNTYDPLNIIREDDSSFSITSLSDNGEIPDTYEGNSTSSLNGYVSAPPILVSVNKTDILGNRVAQESPLPLNDRNISVVENIVEQPVIQESKQKSILGWLFNY